MSQKNCVNCDVGVAEIHIIFIFNINPLKLAKK